MRRNFIKNNKGFTLIELVAALTITGIVSASSLGIISGLREKACTAVDAQQASIIRDAILIYMLQTNDYDLDRIGTGLTDTALITTLGSEPVVIPDNSQDGDIPGSYGPYLSNTEAAPKQKNMRGWKITINTKSLDIAIAPDSNSNIPITFTP